MVTGWSECGIINLSLNDRRHGPYGMFNLWILMFQARVYYRPDRFLYSPGSFNPASRTMSSSPCVQMSSPVTSSLSSINPKTLIISFGKVTIFLSIHSRLTTSLQPDLQYYLPLEMQSPLAISQSQTPKEHTTMEDLKKAAMTSTSKSSTIIFGFVFYCESYLSRHTLRVLIFCK